MLNSNNIIIGKSEINILKNFLWEDRFQQNLMEPYTFVTPKTFITIGIQFPVNMEILCLQDIKVFIKVECLQRKIGDEV